ncbi:MAG: RNA polymerase sigma-54 factor [Nitrospira bacterium HGW-Nitrospira-1]|nr:MAG: RNA polymerase sigma-54 factor [Nitrospira bacterium HGW-Nitrospira-1]
MAMESRLELKLSQKLVLTPQLQMAIKLLQMPQLELSQTITQELIENPFLEELSDVTSSEELTQEEKESLEETPQDTDDTELSLEKLARLSTDDYFEERGADGRDLGYFTSGNVTHPSYEYFLSTATDLFEHLIWQLRLSKESEEIREAAEFIIGNIDENGYLRITEEEISELSKADIETVKKALTLVQSFDPPGIAARDVRECLQLQLKSMKMQGALAERLIVDNLELVGKRKYQQLSKEYDVSVEDILSAVKVIESLDPKPAKKFFPASADYIIPDVFILKTDSGYQIVLNDESLPKIKINNYYQRLLKQKDCVPKEERQFLENKLRSAVWLLKSLDQRNRTIYRVTESILNFQRDFFDKGVNVLKPLNLKDIASELNLHESTISRVTSNKYLSCPRGIYCFKYFFSNAISGDSGELSSTSVKEMVREIISEEDRSAPHSDMRIVDIFKSRNITIARRTIAKYRDELKIRSQSQRRR